MIKLRLFTASGVLPRGLFVTCLVLAGCEKSDQITTYTVPKHESLQTTKFLAEQSKLHPKPKSAERMIGIVIPQQDSQWFFKIQGDIEAVAAREAEIREFLKTLRFAPAKKPEWTLPATWQELPGNEMRAATLVLTGDPALEMSVTKLPTAPDVPVDEQVLANINRWRGQLSLPPIEKDDLETQSEKLTFGDVVAYWINIVGRPKPRPAGMPQPPVKPQQENPGTESKGPAFEKPEGWTEGRPNQFAVVSLKVQDGDSKLMVTVTSARGSREDNVNRWRGQIKLDPLEKAEFEKIGKKVEVGQLAGEWYEMTNEGTTIFGVIVEDRGQTWFVKLFGTADLAERERPKFEAFLKSLRFE